MRMGRCAHHVGDRARGELGEAEEEVAARNPLLVRVIGAARLESEDVAVHAGDGEGAHPVDEEAKGARQRDHEGAAERPDGQTVRRDGEVLPHVQEEENESRDHLALVRGELHDVVDVGRDVEGDALSLCLSRDEVRVDDLRVGVVLLGQAHVLESGHYYRVGV